MKVAFIHDFHAVKIDNEYFSTGFSYDIWKRYLTTFNELVIVSRLKEEERKYDFRVSSGENVTFKPMEEYTSIFSFLINYKKIKTKMEEVIENTDGVIIRLPSILGFLAANICREKNKKYCVEVVGSAFDSFWYHGVVGKPLSFFLESKQKRAIKNSSVAIYVTGSYLQVKYPSLGNMYGKVSNASITKTNFDAKDIEYEQNKKNFKIGLVGSSFVKYKGHITALKTLRELLDQGYDIVLSLVGQGPSKYLENNIKKLGLQNNVEVLGMLHGREKMDEWYQNLDFYIQPSLTEGLCRSVMEAIENNIPTFATLVGGNPEIVSEEYLIRKHDYKRLVSLIERAIKDPNYARENIIKNNKKISEFQSSKIKNRRNKALSEYKNILKEVDII